MSTATYLQRGETWDYTNTGTTPLEPGTIVVVGGRIGVVGGGGAGALQPGALGVVELTGIFRIDKAASTAFAQGDLVYWDSATGTATKTKGTVLAGMCAWPAAAADARVLVDIGKGAPAAAASSEGTGGTGGGGTAGEQGGS